MKYENHVLGDVRLWEVGYVAEGRVHEAGSFHRENLHGNGWTLLGSDFDAGELDLRARRGDLEMLVEIGQANELVEIEMEVYEPRKP